MQKTARLSTFAFLLLMLVPFAAAQQQTNCPMGMETHFAPSIFYTLNGAGVCHLRIWDDQANWIDSETSRGVYNWKNLDTMLNEANTLGVDVLFTFGKVPGWASSNPTDPNCADGYHAGDCAPPSDVNSGDNYFKEYVTALMQHTGTQITYFEMWNEPYNPPYWDGTPEELEIMVADAAQIIRSMNPNAVILTPSISPWKNQQVFLTGFLNACQGNVSFDIFAMHDYTWGGPPEKLVSEVQSVESFQTAMGLQNLPLWSAEGSDKEWSTFTQQQKNDFVARYYALELNYGSKRHYWYSWNVSTVGQLMNTPAATVYKTIGAWFTGMTHTGCTQKGYGYICTERDANGALHPIVWMTQGTANYPTKASQYQTTDGVTHQVVGGLVPVNDSPIFILQ